MTDFARMRRRLERRRAIRAAKIGLARDAIGKLEPGFELYCLTFGQFSLIDVLEFCLEQTGPADVDLATWTVADAAIDRCAALLEDGRLRRLRWVVDNSYPQRHPAYCARLRRKFGDAAIRTTRSHAKFCSIRNSAWSIAIRTSMNLNENIRLESLDLSEGGGLAEFLSAVVDSIFSEQLEGNFLGELTALAAIDNVEIQHGTSARAIRRELRLPTTGDIQWERG